MPAFRNLLLMLDIIFFLNTFRSMLLVLSGLILSRLINKMFFVYVRVCFEGVVNLKSLFVSNFF